MRAKPIIKAYYGNKMLIKKYCSDCDFYAFVIANKYACCDRPANLEDDFIHKKKRESLAAEGRGYIPVKVKREILRHQNHQCIYCGTSLNKKGIRLHFDHFVPFVYIEASERGDLVASCNICNQIKGCLLFNSIQEARIYIIQKRESKKLDWFDYFGGSYEVSKI